MFASSQFRIWCTVRSIINFLKSISSPNVPFMTEDLLGQNPLKRLDLKVNAFSMFSVAQPWLCVVWPVGRQRIRRNKKTTWPVWDCILPPKPQIPPTLFVNWTWFQISSSFFLFPCHISVKIQDKESLHHTLPVILLTNREKHRDNKQLTWPLWKKLINSVSFHADPFKTWTSAQKSVSTIKWDHTYSWLFGSDLNWTSLLENSIQADHQLHPDRSHDLIATQFSWYSPIDLSGKSIYFVLIFFILSTVCCKPLCNPSQPQYFLPCSFWLNLVLCPRFCCCFPRQTHTLNN